MVEAYFLAKKIVEDRFGVNYLYYPMMVIALSILLFKYYDYSAFIATLFYYIDFYIEDSSIVDIMKRNNINYPISFKEEDVNNNLYEINGVSFDGNFFSFDDNMFVKYERSKPFLICDSEKCSPSQLLNVFIHEMNHLIKGFINNQEFHNYSNTREYSIRNGVSLYHCKYDVSSDTLFEYQYFDILDEVINTIQTTDMIQDIFQLKEIISDRKISEYLNTLSPDELKSDFGYNSCVKLFRPLWENDSFRNMIEKELLEGDLSNLTYEFDSIMGHGSFMDMADTLDDIEYIDSLSNNYLKLAKLKFHFLKLVRKYNKCTKFVYHR